MVSLKRISLTTATKSNTKLLEVCLFIVSCILIAYGKHKHELWIDEWQAFGIARTAKNPVHLYHLIQYEGHPYLYFLFLFGWQFISKSIFGLKLFHLFFACGAMFFLLVKSNFSLILKILLACSIYFLWEYTVLNRVYVLCIFFIFLYTYYLKEKKGSIIVSCLLFTTLFQLDGYSAMLAMLLGVYYMCTYCTQWSQRIVLVIVALLNGIVLFYTTKQPTDATFSQLPSIVLNKESLLYYMRYFDFGLSMHHAYQYNQWDFLYFFPAALVVIFYLIFIGYIFYTLQNKAVKIGLLVSLLGLTYLNIQISACATRHVGFYFIAVLIAFWLDAKDFQKHSLRFLLISLVVVHAFWGIRMYIHDCRNPFSMNSTTASYIQTNFPATTPIVAYGEVSLCGLSGYLQKPVYNILSNKHAWYYTWNIQEDIPFGRNDTTVFYKINDYYKQQGPFILATNTDRRMDWFVQTMNKFSSNQKKGVKKMPEFWGAIMSTENFYLYYIDSTITLQKDF